MGGVNLTVDADGTPTDPALRTCLKMLAQRGAKLLTHGGGAVVEVPRKGSELAVAWVDASGVPALRAADWITEIGSDRYILAPAGRCIVRLMKAAPSPAEATGDALPAMLPPLPEPITAPAPESSLAWLKARRDKNGAPYLCDKAFAAAERLRADFDRAQMMPRITADWDAIARTGDESRGMAGRMRDQGGGAASARERLNRALSAMLPEFRNLLLDVCCYEIGLQAAGKANHLPQRSAHYILMLALNALARHYGMLPADGDDWQPRSRPRHWGSDDYRPTIDGG